MIARWAGFSPSAARSCRAGFRGCARGTSASSRPPSSGRASWPCCPTSRGTPAEALALRGRRPGVRRRGAAELRGVAIRHAPGADAAAIARRVVGAGEFGRGRPRAARGPRPGIARRVDSRVDRARDRGIRRGREVEAPAPEVLAAGPARLSLRRGRPAAPRECARGDGSDGRGSGDWGGRERERGSPGGLDRSAVGGNARREPCRALRGRGRAGSVPGVRAGGPIVRRVAALAGTRGPGGAGVGLARPRAHRAHAALRGGRLEPLRRRTDMEVILRESVQHLGAAGDVVKVKDGYARNYLLPKGLAYPATEANKKKIAFEAARIAKLRAAEKGVAETEASRIAEVHLRFDVKVGEEDKLYGSITSSDIQRKLEELGIRVDKRKVDLPEPIRELGDFRVGIKLHPDVRPEIQVSVVKE